MEYKIWLEIFGYIGSALVIFSMTMTSMTRLRIINIIGGTISMIYSFLSMTLPIALMNAVLIAINITHLITSALTKKTEGYLSPSLDRAENAKV